MLLSNFQGKRELLEDKKDILPYVLCSLVVSELVLVAIIGTHYLGSREKKKEREKTKV